MQNQQNIGKYNRANSRPTENILKRIDQLGKEYQFTIDGGSFRTAVGGLLTIFICASAVLLSWYFGKDMYERRQPHFLQRSDLLDSPPFIYPWKNGLKNTDMFVAFRLMLGFTNGETMDDLRYIEHYHAFYTRVYNKTLGKVEKKKIYKKPVKCTTKYIDEEDFKKNQLDKYFCIDYDLKSKFGGNFLKNKEQAEGRQYFYIKFCNKDTEKRYNITCATKEEMEKRLIGHGKLYVEIIYQNNLVYPSQFAHPYKKTYFLYYNGIDIWATKKALYTYLYFSGATVETDSAIIFSDTKKQTFYEFESVGSTFQPPSTEFKKYGNFFFKMIVKMGRTFKEYERSYIKIPEVIAEVGGFLSLALIFVDYFYAFYLDNEFSIYIYKKLFYLQIDSGEDDQPLDAKVNINQSKNGDEGNGKMNTPVSLPIDSTGTPNAALKSSLNIDNSSKGGGKDFKDIAGISNFDIGNTTNNDVSNVQLNQENKGKLYKKFLSNKQNNNNELILNKEIAKLLQFKRRKRATVEIGKCERNNFIYCNKDSFKDKHDPTKLRYELMIAAEAAVEQKTEIFELWKSIDQFRLVEKLLLNECQTFMIQNRGLQLITNESKLSSTEVKELEAEKFEASKVKLVEYLNKRKDNNSLTLVDTLLVKYLDEKLKENLKDVASNIIE